MSTRHRRLSTALQLQAIEKARRSAAELDLADARAANGKAEERMDAAAAALDAAEGDWANGLSCARLDLEMQRLLAGQVLASEEELRSRDSEKADTGQRLERSRTAWLELEASVRSGERLLKRWRRDDLKHAARRADQALADATSWKWFRK